MHFEFATATRVLFGPGTAKEAVPLMAALGQRALLVTGRDPSRADGVRQALREKGVETRDASIEGEPTLEAVQAGVTAAREAGCDMVVAMGGGSALDAGKAIAAVMTNPGRLQDYLEVIGEGRPLEKAPVPWVALPTTSGTGAEVTRNAVLASPEHRVKVSLRSPRMLPRLAVVDPELTLGLPADVTASTGMDALTQLIEPYVSSRANPLTDSLCREGIGCVVRSLRRVHQMGGDLDARQDMSLASLLGGMALANAGLGAVHGFAAPIGGMFPAPHGAVCAALLPHVMEANLNALTKREPQSISLRRYEALGPMLTGQERASAQDGLAWVRDLCRDLKIPGLARYGLREDQVRDVVEKATKASSMKANPLVLRQEELERILRAAL